MDSCLPFRLQHHKRNKSLLFFKAALIAIVLLLVLSMAAGQACMGLRHGIRGASGQHGFPASGISDTAGPQDAASRERPFCCQGCARAFALPDAFLSALVERAPAYKQTPGGSDAAVETRHFFSLSLLCFSIVPVTPFKATPPPAFLLNCALLC